MAPICSTVLGLSVLSKLIPSAQAIVHLSCIGQSSPGFDQAAVQGTDTASLLRTDAISIGREAQRRV